MTANKNPLNSIIMGKKHMGHQHSILPINYKRDSLIFTHFSESLISRESPNISRKSNSLIKFEILFIKIVHKYDFSIYFIFYSCTNIPLLVISF